MPTDSYLYPKVSRVKEKFGTLRFYSLKKVEKGSRKTSKGGGNDYFIFGF